MYSFGNGKAEGRGDQKDLLGGKGAGLAEMTHIGLPVPAGFTITTDACSRFYKKNRKWPDGLQREVRRMLTRLEKACKKKLGDPKSPLLVSVRSGAAKSMPGMMETVLNLGLNDESVEGLAAVTNNPRFAWDSYRRFIQMYSSVVVGLSREFMEGKLEAMKDRLSIENDTDLSADHLRELCREFKEYHVAECGEAFPQDPWPQLLGAITAVFESWHAPKAVKYREVEHITGLCGTAVSVCQMVFGNMGSDSGTGVCFTREPNTGENEFYGDLLMDAQGEDVVAGIRTPIPLNRLAETNRDVYEQLCGVRVLLETHYKDMQDVEFTVERGKLYILQCRSGKRTPTATFRIAVDQATKPLLTKSEANRLVKKKHILKKTAAAAVRPVISKEDAILRIEGVDVERMFHKVIDPSVDADELSRRNLAKGIEAVPGAACGEVVFSAERAEQLFAEGREAILVRKATSPEDVGGMHASVGILTATGGKTSHAAVVARGWGKCCIVGCQSLRIDYDKDSMCVGGRMISAGDWLTLDGSNGRVYEGKIDLADPFMPDEFATLMKWCDALRRLRVRANADTPYDSERAIKMGAEGIGLCRTEHMFFDTEERRLAIQEMIVADSEDARRCALDKLLPFQRQDFISIFEAMKGRPVTIRLVDPPLHEFVPHSVEGQRDLAEKIGVDFEHVSRRVEVLHESNPMLGHRGCRLAITYPEILDMQVRAIIEAAVECRSRGVKVLPEIMIPLCIDAKELQILVDRTRAVADEILRDAGIRLNYLVGTMIETPRAALTAGRMAGVADFFSFGTNDLTQTVMALSRDDAGRFLPAYLDADMAAIFDRDPFQTIDVDGVGALVRSAVEAGRKTDPKLKIGICGEHGGDPESVWFCHDVGIDYVSCSPFRLPVARLAAAQAVILEKRRLKTRGRSSSAKRRGAGKSKVRRKAKATTKTKAKVKPKAVRAIVSRPKSMSRSAVARKNSPRGGAKRPRSSVPGRA
ncbi:MAG: PEP-utilizing enzyme [Planctomycetota bacterium]|nr:PEP-utilizing enzyme [Planctomycetota bacterium]